MVILHQKKTTICTSVEMDFFCFYMNLKIVFTFNIFYSHNNQNPLCRDVIEGLTLKIA